MPKKEAPESTTVSLTIDGKDVFCKKDISVLQACAQAGVSIPAFCYHKNLKVAGNCRMCLVEVKGASSPVASCATLVQDNMEVLTTTPSVADARKSTLEFLLINHPLECPVCDKGGECDLQELTMKYGADRSRFKEAKRAVVDKNFGSLIATAMTRCIQCTRCVRFAQDIAGAPELGIFNRGEDREITTALDHLMKSELSGNVIDLCPVGALTSKPYAAKGRPWEMKSIPSIDITDAVGSHTSINIRGPEIMRIMPRFCAEINEDWISDKARFVYEGLNVQRLDTPYIRKEGRLEPTTWVEALKTVVRKLTSVSPKEIGVIAGDLMDVESLFLMRKLLDSMEIPHRDCRQHTEFLPTQERGDYLFNSTIQGIEQADACLIIGANPRLEASLINVRLRKRWLAGDFPIGLIGPAVDLTYPYEHLSTSASILNEIIAKKHPFAKVLEKAQRLLLILGEGALGSIEAEAIYKTARAIAQEFGMIREDWNGFNVLHTAAGCVGGLDVGFVPTKEGYDVSGMLKAARAGRLKVLYLLGADEIPTQALGDTFVIYQGHHGDAGAHRADVIFPGASYVEKDAFYVNTEGRVQEALRVIAPLGEAREDWRIIRGLSEVLGYKLPYDSREQIIQDLKKTYPAFNAGGQTISASLTKLYTPSLIQAGLLKTRIGNFYMTNSICRASALMANVAKERE